MRQEYDFSQGKRGSVALSSPGKTRSTIRRDSDMVNWIRCRVSQKGGGNYQTVINEAWRSYRQR